MHDKHVIIRQLPLRRRVFEEPRQASRGEMFEDDYGDLVTYKFRGKTEGKYKIWKEVSE